MSPTRLRLQRELDFHTLSMFRFFQNNIKKLLPNRLPGDRQNEKNCPLAGQRQQGSNGDLDSLALFWYLGPLWGPDGGLDCQNYQNYTKVTSEIVPATLKI